jgi:hypothetical protein
MNTPLLSRFSDIVSICMLPSILRICTEKSPAAISVVTFYPSTAIVVSFDAGSDSVFRYLHLFDTATFGADPGNESLPSIPDLELMVGRRTGRLYETSLNWRPGLFQQPALSRTGDEPAEETYCTPELDLDAAWPAIPTGKISRTTVPIRAVWREDGALIIQLGEEMDGRWIQPDRNVALFISHQGELGGLTVMRPDLQEAVRRAVNL